MEFAARKKWFVGAILLVLVCGGTAWAWRHFRAEPMAADPQVTKVGELGRQLAIDANKDMSEEERKNLALKLFQEVGQMTPEQRRQAFTKEFQPIIQARIDKFFTLETREEQLAHLDADINQMEQLAKWAKMFQSIGGTFGPRRDSKGAEGEPAADGPPKAGGPGGPGGNTMSAEERDKRRRERLDATTPEQRAKQAEYVRQLMERRKELGLPAMGGPRPR